MTTRVLLLSAAIALWRNMAPAGGSRPPQWLSTHPDPSTRLRELQARAQALVPVVEAALGQAGRPRCQSPGRLRAAVPGVAATTRFLLGFDPCRDRCRLSRLPFQR